MTEILKPSEKMNSVLDKINRLANEPHQIKTKNTFDQT